MTIPLLRRRLLLGIFTGLAARSAQAWSLAGQSQAIPLGHGATLHELNVAGADSVDLSLVHFTSSTCTLRIVDEPSQANAQGLAAAMRGIGAIAGTNGAFFSPQFDPLGLYVVDGKRSGSWTRSSLLGGVILVRKGKLQILWRDEYTEAPGTTQLVQTGPRLVNAGKAITGLDSKASRPRTFVATDGKGGWCLGIARYCSLAQLAEMLATPSLLPMLPTVSRAINLDGGRSTGLWAQLPSGSEFYESPMVAVRNYVAVVPK
jgi:uncharacterized protein YigE (DUF2233 family)